MEMDKIEDRMILHALSIEKLREMQRYQRDIKHAQSDFVRTVSKKNLQQTEIEYNELIKELKTRI